MKAHDSSLKAVCEFCDDHLKKLVCDISAHGLLSIVICVVPTLEPARASSTRYVPWSVCNK
jgi:hypothetical protein